MPDTIYDSRFFFRTYAKDVNLKGRVQSELKTRGRKAISAITIHEVYRIALEEEGRDVAKLRKAAIERDFEIISVDSEIAAEAAEIKVSKGRDFPLADAIIAATAKLTKLDCFTDDEHIKGVPAVRTRWF